MSSKSVTNITFFSTKSMSVNTSTHHHPRESEFVSDWASVSVNVTEPLDASLQGVLPLTSSGHFSLCVILFIKLGMLISFSTFRRNLLSGSPAKKDKLIFDLSLTGCVFLRGSNSCSGLEQSFD